MLQQHPLHHLRFSGWGEDHRHSDSLMSGYGYNMMSNGPQTPQQQQQLVKSNSSSSSSSSPMHHPIPSSQSHHHHHPLNHSNNSHSLYPPQSQSLSSQSQSSSELDQQHSSSMWKQPLPFDSYHHHTMTQSSHAPSIPVDPYSHSNPLIYKQHQLEHQSSPLYGQPDTYSYSMPPPPHPHPHPHHHAVNPLVQAASFNQHPSNPLYQENFIQTSSLSDRLGGVESPLNISKKRRRAVDSSSSSSSSSSSLSSSIGHASSSVMKKGKPLAEQVSLPPQSQAQANRLDALANLALMFSDSKSANNNNKSTAAAAAPGVTSASTKKPVKQLKKSQSLPPVTEITRVDGEDDGKVIVARLRAVIERLNLYNNDDAQPSASRSPSPVSSVSSPWSPTSDGFIDQSPPSSPNLTPSPAASACCDSSSSCTHISDMLRSLESLPMDARNELPKLGRTLVDELIKVEFAEISNQIKVEQANNNSNNNNNTNGSKPSSRSSSPKQGRQVIKVKRHSK